MKGPDQKSEKPETRFCVDCKHVGANKDGEAICNRPHDADLVTGEVRPGGWRCSTERYNVRIPVAQDAYEPACAPFGRFFEKKLDTLFEMPKTAAGPITVAS